MSKPVISTTSIRPSSDSLVCAQQRRARATEQQQLALAVTAIDEHSQCGKELRRLLHFVDDHGPSSDSSADIGSRRLATLRGSSRSK